MCNAVGFSSLGKVKIFFLFFFYLGRGKGAVSLLCFFGSIPEKGILDFIAHCSVIPVFTVTKLF